MAAASERVGDALLLVVVVGEALPLVVRYLSEKGGGVLREAAQAFGNKQVEGFANKAKQDIESGIKKGQSFASEISSNVDKIDRLGSEFMNAFR